MAVKQRSFSYQWGPYFQPDSDDDGKLVKVANDAMSAGVATRRMAVEKVAPVFGIENVDEALAAVEEEAEEREAKEVEREEAKAHALGKAAGANAVGVRDPGAAGGNAPKAAKGGSGSAAAGSKKGASGNAKRPRPGTSR